MIPKELQLAHDLWAKSQLDIQEPKLFTLSVSLAEIAYGKSDETQAAVAMIDRLEAEYAIVIKKWRWSLLLAERCRVLRLEESNG